MPRGVVAIVLLLCFVAPGLARVPAPEGQPTAVENTNNYDYVWTRYVPDDYPTIQAAIDAAGNGDQVVVRPGTYYENIDFLGKMITVISEYGADSTIIDAGYTGSVVTFQGGETRSTRLEGFTIMNGFAADGSGIYCNGASPTMANNVIINNYATGSGGGVYCTGNAASPLLQSNVITENDASVAGGGISCDSSLAVVENNVISHNYSSGVGGGISCGSSVTIVNNVISSNSTGYYYSGDTGGGIYCEIFTGELPPTVTSNTVFGNSAHVGGGIYVLNESSTPMTITNTIFWNNSAYSADDEISISGSGGLAVSYCDVSGGYTGAGNIDENPYFLNSAVDDFRIAYESPCRDAGDSTAAGLPDEDFEGDPRVLFGTVDIGADEVDEDLASRTLLVPSVYSTIQAAIDSAFPLDTVLVAAGAYFENIDFQGKIITVLSESGPTATIIDGNVAGSVVTFQGGETRDTRLEGFTIQNGHVSDKGGGIYCVDSSPTIADNVIVHNTAVGTYSYEGQGGGIYCTGANASPMITTNLIAGNSSQFLGGGIACFATHAVIENNEIAGNYCSGDGGGIFVGTSAAITNNLIVENATSSLSGSAGGGVYCRIENYESPPNMVNNTIVGNFSYTGGGLCISNSSLTPVLVTNTIIWGNAAYNAPEILGTGSLIVSYCDVQGGYSGTGNINADPLFTSGPQGYHYLMQTVAGQPWDSPCVDAGDPGSSMITGTTRTDGVQDSGVIDMGYHYGY